MNNEMINEEYRHARIHLTEEQRKEILPGNLVDICKYKKTVMFGSIDGLNNLQAIALFSVSHIYSQEMVLEYVAVSEERRYEGLAHELLTHCENGFRTCGIRSICVRIAGEIEEVARMYDYLVREKYIPVVFCGHIISYDLSDVGQCELMGHGSELMRAFGRKIKKIGQNIEIAVRRFIQQKADLYIKQEVYDREYSRICWAEEQIAGVIFFKRTDEKTIVLTGCCIEPCSNEKYVFGALLYAALHDLCASMGGDTKLMLQLHTQKYYEWVKKLLGQPRQDLILQEYIRRIK